jgi:hypothetical protein
MSEFILKTADGRAFLTITEVAEGPFFVNQLFRRKFGSDGPDIPRHFIAFYKDLAGALHVAGFSHMMRFNQVYLSGGSCSDGNTLKRMSAEELAMVKAQGGIWAMILRHCWTRLDGECDAYFGHCGDPRAREVALATGFEVTHTPVHIVRWHKPLSAEQKTELLDSVIAIGLF